MTTYTKKQLLDLAKEHEIVGRHEMDKEALLSALEDVDAFADDSDSDSDKDDSDLEPIDIEIASADQVVAMKKKAPSSRPRDPSGKVQRRGNNLSGNVPWQPKYYALAPQFANEKRFPAGYADALAKAPMQVQLILKYMRASGIVLGEDSQRGGEIVEGAINAGYLKTKIEPAALFSYYAKILQALSVVHDESVEG